MKKRSNAYKPLSAWLNKNQPLASRFYKRNFNDRPNKDWIIWLGIEEIHSLHEASEISWLSLIQSRKLTRDYLKKAGKLIGGLDGSWLDSEESYMIDQEIGQPPDPCLPIYLISTVDKRKEKIVYVGKTKTNSRFSGGHVAALKLHQPKFSNMKKRFYRCSIWLNINDEYISIDWIQPESLALEILDSIESKLIFDFQPELNTAKKVKDKSNKDFAFTIQNFTKSKFL